MLGNIVHFDKEDGSLHLPPPALLQPSAQSGHPVQPITAPRTHSSIDMPEMSHDLAWMQGMIEQQTLLFEAAQRERASAIAELKRIAQTLCKEAWDAKARAGEILEAWPPIALGNLIIQSTTILLRNARLSQDPALAEKHRRLLDELAEAKADNHRLRQRCRAAEDAVRELRTASVKETARQQKIADKKSDSDQDNKQRFSRPAKSDIRDRRSMESRDVSPVDLQAASAIPTANSVDRVVTDSSSVHQATVAQEVAHLVGSGNARVDEVIRVIAQTGLCRWKDITGQLADLWEVRSSTGSIDSAIKKAIDFDLLRIEEVRLDWGGKPTGKVLILTEHGKRCAASLGISPVESHYSRGLALHKDGSHFYAIVEIASILANHYARVDFFPAAVPLDVGKYYPDVVAITAAGQRIYVEVERGTHKDERDRDKKWLRAAAANNGTIYLATPNLEVMTAIVAEICEIRDQQPGKIDRILAFNVRTFRERKGQVGDTIWSSEG